MQKFSLVIIFSTRAKNSYQKYQVSIEQFWYELNEILMSRHMFTTRFKNVNRVQINFWTAGKPIFGRTKPSFF